MANHKATGAIAANGGFKTNPNRRRIDPPSAGEIGKPPEHLSEEEKATWQELVATSPQGVLQASDSVAVELAVTLLSDYRRDRASFNAGRLAVLQKALSAIGRTPIDRGRVAVAPLPADPNDPWASLLEGSGRG